VGDTGFVRRILLRPAAKRELHGDQQRGRLAHQPGLDARRAHDALDRGGGRRSRRREGEQQSRERQRTRQQSDRSASFGPHERFSQ
jgi:hypothetical protein